MSAIRKSLVQGTQPSNKLSTRSTKRRIRVVDSCGAFRPFPLCEQLSFGTRLRSEEAQGEELSTKVLHRQGAKVLR